jgi:glycosyltransferase involved in cell wall biosynthesis
MSFPESPFTAKLAAGGARPTARIADWSWLGMAAVPLVTLITPSLNAGAYLRQALESVRLQNDPAFEHIIADGGSTDDTMSIVSDFPHVQFVQRPDKGSHDAINQALKLARGEIISFINADDVLARNALAEVRACFARHDNAAAVYTSAAFFSQDAGGPPRCDFIYHAPPPRDLVRSVMFGVTAFNSWFFRREVFARIGHLDADIDFSADREFLIRLVTHEKAAALPQLLYGYRMHGGSRTMGGQVANVLAFVREHLEIAEKLLANAGSDRLARRLAYQFRAFEKAREALYSARSGDARGAFARLMCHIAAHPGWPLDFAVAALTRRALMQRLWRPCPPDLDMTAIFTTLR